MWVIKAVFDSARKLPTVGVGLDIPGCASCANSTNARAVDGSSAVAHNDGSKCTHMESDCAVAWSNREARTTKLESWKDIAGGV